MKISLSGKWMLAIVFLSMNCAAPALAQKKHVVFIASYIRNLRYQWSSGLGGGEFGRLEWANCRFD